MRRRAMAADVWLIIMVRDISPAEGCRPRTLSSLLLVYCLMTSLTWRLLFMLYQQPTVSCGSAAGGKITGPREWRMKTRLTTRRGPQLNYGEAGRRKDQQSKMLDKYTDCLLQLLLRFYFSWRESDSERLLPHFFLSCFVGLKSLSLFFWSK